MGADLAVHRLTPDRLADYLGFFDGPAFADNPAWSACYCHYPHVAPALDWTALTRDQNRTAVAARIEVGEMDGYLAYRDDRVVGWMSTQSRHQLPHCFARFSIAATPLDVPVHLAATIACFVVDPGERRRGVARTLLAQGCAALAARGFTLAEAYPLLDVAVDSPAAHCRGPLSLYLSEGFTPYLDDGRVRVVRRALAPA